MKAIIKTSKTKVLPLLGTIKVNIVCQNIKTIFTINTIILNKCLLFLYIFLISFNFFIIYTM